MIKQHMRKLFVLSILCIAALSLIIGCRPFGGSDSDDGVGPVITEPQIPVSLSQVEDAIQEAIKKDPEVAWQPEITTFVQNVQKEEIAALLGSNDSAPPTQDQIQELVQTDFFKEVEVNEAVDPDQLFSMDAQEDFSSRFDPAFSVRKSVRGSYYLPPRINWVDKDGKNFVTPVKSQGQYGTCAAFASTATLESNLKIAFGDPTFDFDLSEAWLWFYGTGKFPVPSRPKPTPPLLGGWQNYLAFFFLLPRNGYIISESEAPYSLLQLFPEFGKISENANRYNVNGIFSLRSATAMKLALQKGPVAAIMRTNAYIFYYGPNSGIYSYIPIYDANGKELKFPDQPDSSPGAHAITVVGYDDGQGCWICKNSWGSDWGENGFFRARYGKSILEDSGFLISVPVMINERSPGAQQTEVPVNSSVVIKFGEKLRAETVTNKAFKLERLPDNQAVSFAASYHSGSQTVVLKPSAPLAMASSYRVTATTDVRSSDGDSLLQNDTWVFYTEGFSEKVNPRAEFIRRPESISGSKKALFEIGGYKIDAFRYKLDNEAWSEEFPADRIVELQNLSDGQHVVRVIGRSGSIWQSESEVTSWPWQINSSVSIGYFAYGPDAVTSNSKPDFSFKADDMTAVKLKLNDFGWTSWIPVVNNEYLFGFTGEINTIGTHTLLAVARNSLGVEQPIESAAKWQWVYDPAFNSNAVLLAQPALEGTFTTARFEVGGDKIVAYKYLVDAQTAFSAEFPVSTPIQLVDLKPGDHLIKVLGKTDGGVWQATDKPTTYAWKILPMPELKFVLTPPAINSVDRIGFIIDGQGYTAFKYQLGNQNWSSETPQTFFEFKNLTAIGITGQQTFRVVGRTADGNWLAEAQAASFTWLQDISIPVKAEFAELPAQITGSTSAVFKVTGDRLTHWAYVLDGSPYIMALASESANFSNLTAGYHTLYIIGRDWSGKWQGWENAASFTWLIDVEPPTAMFVNKPVSITNQTGFELKVGGAGVVSYRYQLNGGSWSESLPVTQSATISNLKSGKQMLSIIGADAAGNWQPETAATRVEWSVDLEKPAATISTTVSGLTNVAKVAYTIEFSKPVTGFELADLQINNGTAANLQMQTENLVWKFEIVTQANGPVEVSLKADAVTDTAGNSNDAAAGPGFTLDTTPPGCTMTAGLNGPTSLATVRVRIEFDRNVQAFVAENLIISNGNAAVAREVTAGRIWEVDITPAADGEVKVTLPAGKVADSIGNLNKEASELAFVSDRTVPAAIISTTAPNPTGKSPIPVLVSFSESVTGFDAGDLQAVNATIGNFRQVEAGKVFSLELTPRGTGLCEVSLVAGAFADLAGNTNAVAEKMSIVYDGIRPAAIIASTISGTTNALQIPVTVEFSKPVTGFELADLQISNGSASNLQMLTENRIWRFEIAPASEGELRVSLAADKAFDSAGNGNDAASDFSIIHDKTAPKAVITASVAGPSNLDLIPVRIEFDKTVSGFSNSSLSITNGTAEAIREITAGRIWEADIRPQSDGEVKVDLPGGTITDLAGNGNSAAVEFSMVRDTAAPSAVLTTEITSPTNVSPIPVKITFNEPVEGFELGDLSLSGVSAENLQTIENNRIFSFAIAPQGNGTCRVSLPAARVNDQAGNGNQAVPELQIEFDSENPTVAISSTVTGPTNAALIPVKIEFSKPVSGFTADEIIVNNGAAANFRDTGAGQTYEADVTPAANGLVKINVAANAAADVSGNPNLAGSELILAVDYDRPVIDISANIASPTNAALIPVKITFNEAVSGFSADEISVINGNIGNFREVTAGHVWEADITPSGSGVVKISIGAGIAFDAVGNSNLAADDFSMLVDTIRPSVEITSAAASPVSVSPIPLQIEFSEPVVGFDSADIQVINGAVVGFQAVEAGRVWSAGIVPVTSGTVAVSLPEMAASDLVGNSSLATGVLQLIYDNEVPVVVKVTCSKADGQYGVGSQINIGVEFSESVVVAPAGALPVLKLETGPQDRIATYTGGTGSKVLNFLYIVGESDNSSDLDYQNSEALVLNGSTIKDSAGNSASLTLPTPGTSGSLAFFRSIVIDTVAPTVVLSNFPPARTNQRNFSITVGGEGVVLYRWRMDGYSWSTERGVSSDITLIELSEGNHYIEVVGCDLAGNWSDILPAETYAWEVDATGPVAPVIFSSHEIGGYCYGVIPGDLSGSGNLSDNINDTLQQNFARFKVNMANNAEGAEFASLTIRLSDSAGNTAICHGEMSPGGNVWPAGNFADDAINAFVDGDLKIEAWLIDALGNNSSITTVKIRGGISCKALSASLWTLNPEAEVVSGQPIQFELRFTKPVATESITTYNLHSVIECLNGRIGDVCDWVDNRTFRTECFVNDSVMGNPGSTEGSIKITIPDNLVYTQTPSSEHCPRTEFHILIFKKPRILVNSGRSLELAMAVDQGMNLFLSYPMCVTKVTNFGQQNGPSEAIYAGAPMEPGIVDGNGANARFNKVIAMATDQSGNLYVVDVVYTEGSEIEAANSYLRKIDTNSEVTTLLAQDSTSPIGNAVGMAINSAGDIYISTPTRICRYSSGILQVVAGSAEPGFADGNGAAARFSYAQGICLDPDGNLIIADTLNHVIRKMTPDGTVSTILGQHGNPGSVDSGNGSTALLEKPSGVAFDAYGNLIVTNFRGIRKATPEGLVKTIYGFSEPITTSVPLEQESCIVLSTPQPELSFIIRSYPRGFGYVSLVPVRDSWQSGY